MRKEQCGAIAQLGERLHGMQEVSGSIPLSSTKIQTLASAGVFCFCRSEKVNSGKEAGEINRGGPRFMGEGLQHQRGDRSGQHAYQR